MTTKKCIFLILASIGLHPKLTHADHHLPVEGGEAYSHTPSQSMAQRLRFGIQLGPAIVDLGGSDVDGTVVKSAHALSLNGGGFGSVEMTSSLDFQADLMFSTKGADLQAENAPAGGYRLSYVDIIALALYKFPWKMRFPWQTRIRPYVFAGPRVSLLIAARIEDSQGNSGDFRDQLKSADYGLIAGMGLAIHPIWLGALELSARYDLGISQIGDTDDGRDDVKTRMLSVTLGFRCCAHRKKARAVDEAEVPTESVPAPDEVPLDSDPDESVDPDTPDEENFEQPLETGPEDAGELR